MFTEDMSTSTPPPDPDEPQRPGEAPGPPGFPPPGYGRTPPAPGPGQALTTAEERNWAVAAHAGSLLAAWFALGLLAPLVVMLAKGSESAFVRRQAVESLNFQINALFYTILFALLVVVLIGIPLLVAYGVFYLVCVILASVRASAGADFRYPLTIRLVT